MPRPRKLRRVCSLPEINLYGPLNRSAIDKDINSNIIIMTVEEYETIRLIDLEGLMQEDCAQRMCIARTTAQKIYNNARKKLAEALIGSHILKIEGGDYKLYDEGEQGYGCRGCRRKRRGKNMLAGEDIVR